MIRDISKILENAPTGLKLYSPLVGECELDCVINGVIYVKYGNKEGIVLHKDGSFRDGYKCILFPSKEHQTWEDWQSVLLKNGDVVSIHGIICMVSSQGRVIDAGGDYRDVDLSQAEYARKSLGEMFDMLHEESKETEKNKAQTTPLEMVKHLRVMLEDYLPKIEEALKDK